MNDDRDVEAPEGSETVEVQPETVKSRILREIKIAIERAKADTPANYSKANHNQYGKH